MEKTKIEFINTCPCCDGHVAVLQELENRFPGKFALTVYYAGKDFAYLPKYGPLSRGTLIVNETTRYEDLSRKNIEKIVAEAIGEAL